jgi:hypothetical protein
MIEPIKVCDEEAGRPSHQVAEVPDDRRDQQGEDHGEAGVRADSQDRFDRQQRDDAEGHGAVEVRTPKKLKKPDHMTANSPAANGVR